MTEQNAIITQPERSYFLAPAVDVVSAVARYEAMAKFIGKVLRKDVDYGKVPGTTKDTLLKPGAEKLSSFFGLSPRFILRDSVEDWTGRDHDAEPFFYYRYACDLFRGDVLMGEGEGSCNSWEKKHRYRNMQKNCPVCGLPAIIKGKAEYGGGWVCFQKKGGCGAKFKDGDPVIESQIVGQIKNPDPADLPNTLQKMAQKRALVAAVLIATNASEYFTQDLEDFAGNDGPDNAVTVTPITRTMATPEPHGEAAQDELNAQIQNEMDATPPVYTGSQAKIGKNRYPAIWAQLLMQNLANLGGNAFEIDGILIKLQLPQETTPAKVLEAVENYLSEKSGLAGIAPQ